MEKRVLFLGIVLVTLTAASWYLARQQEKVENVVKKDDHRPDYWVTQLDLTEMDPLGQPAHRLRARKMLHFDDDGTRELVLPKLTVYDAQNPPWKISSSKGWVSADNSLILLTENVVVERDASQQLRPIKALTSELRIKPKEQYAETDRHVRIESHADWLESDGARIWFGEPMRFKFLSRVKARYEVH